jgi:ATP-binding cassette subfamily F protein uup
LPAWVICRSCSPSTTRYRTRSGEADADHEKLLDRMQLLQTELEAREAWSFEAQAERVIQRFSLDADALVGTLSGGQKKRLALAQALAISRRAVAARRADQPSRCRRHRVAGGNAGVVGGDAGVHHSRSAFLERVATRIVELDRGSLLSCPGSFSEYQSRKEAMLHDEALNNARSDKFLAQEEVWIRQGIKARRTRNEGPRAAARTSAS